MSSHYQGEAAAVTQPQRQAQPQPQPRLAQGQKHKHNQHKHDNKHKQNHDLDNKIDDACETDIEEIEKKVQDLVLLMKELVRSTTNTFQQHEHSLLTMQKRVDDFLER